jgi:hypothetical protein
MSACLSTTFDSFRIAALYFLVRIGDRAVRQRTREDGWIVNPPATDFLELLQCATIYPGVAGTAPCKSNVIATC